MPKKQWSLCWALRQSYQSASRQHCYRRPTVTASSSSCIGMIGAPWTGMANQLHNSAFQTVSVQGTEVVFLLLFVFVFCLIASSYFCFYISLYYSPGTGSYKPSLWTSYFERKKYRSSFTCQDHVLGCSCVPITALVNISESLEDPHK